MSKRCITGQARQFPILQPDSFLRTRAEAGEDEADIQGIDLSGMVHAKRDHALRIKTNR